MAGIYVHIPFCKQACHYCNFHFSTSTKLKDLLVRSLVREIELRQHEIDQDCVETIYFGGGTPSMLQKGDLLQIVSALQDNFQIARHAEITLEANPDDVDTDRLDDWMDLGFNRISLGIQSFFEIDLLAMNRAHSADDAHRAMETLLGAQFDRVSMDLIYGSSTTTNEMWRANLQHAARYGVGHLSCYALTVEPGTALAYKISAGQWDPVDDERAAEQFALLQEFSQDHGYLHYEISNLALPGQESRHNSNYWSGELYMGLGPAAHSYNGVERSWNVAHNHQYIKAIQDNALPSTAESLSKQDRFNELIMTRLRTDQGIEVAQIREFGLEFFEHFLRESKEHLDRGDLYQKGGCIVIAPQSRFRADGLAAQLFKV